MLCSNCNENLDQGVEICPECGAQVIEEKTFEPLQVQKPKKKHKGLIITIVTLLVLGGLTASGYFFARTQISMLILSPKSYYMMLEARGIRAIKGSLSNQIYTTKDIINKTASISIDASALNSLPSEIKNVIKDFNITINSDMDFTKSAGNTSIGVNYKNDEMLKAVLAQNKNKMGLMIPQVNQTYYTYTDNIFETEQINSIDDIIKVYTGLSKKDTDELLTKYAKEVYFHSINDKSVKYVDSKDINGTNCRGIEVKFDNAFLKQFTESLAKTLKEDTKLKEAAYKAYKKQAEQSKSEVMSQTDFEKSYVDFVDTIKYDATGKDSAVMTVWFDRSENIISRQFNTYTDGKLESDISFYNNKNGTNYTGSLYIETQSEAGISVVSINYSFEKTRGLTGFIPVGTLNIQINDQGKNSRIKLEISKQDSSKYKITGDIDTGTGGSVKINCAYSEKKINAVTPVEFTDSNSKPMSEIEKDGVLEKLQLSLLEKAQKNGLINIFYGLMGIPSPATMGAGFPFPDSM